MYLGLYTIYFAIFSKLVIFHYGNWLEYKLNKTIKYIQIYLSYSKDKVSIHMMINLCLKNMKNVYIYTSFNISN